MRGVLVLVTVVALAASGVAAEAAVVRLRSAAQVDTPDVTLGDVAQLSGPERAVRVLRALVVAEGLKPGGTVRVTVEQVRAALREAGFDLNWVSVTGAREAVVRRRDATAAVRKGASVRVVAAVGAVRVSTSGVALEPGDEGDVVRVRVLATRREVVARVVQPGLVAVVF
ncbi:MAG: flagella basal body P-ring formation protein FlgA [Armatimonadota bacterium]|nr:flagella basal body P-ring formation protein FlgA [Armatimonadota bacterium]MDW8157228.1 flagella basal body P-ring formation protein FlgA [Armatimonadota bacterium]